MNPFETFLTEGRRLTDLYGTRIAAPTAEDEFLDFYTNGKRLDFLRDLIARVAILAYCYDTISGRLADECKELDRRMLELPTVPMSGVLVATVTPEEEDFSSDRRRWLCELDALTSLIYYEAASVVGLLRRLGISLPANSEINYLVKVRDRFLAHVQLSGLKRSKVTRSENRDYGLRDGFIERDVVALSSWSGDDLRYIGARALAIGSSEWREQRRKNEEIILSSTRNEDFKREETLALINAGVRECELGKALRELGKLLETRAIPEIAAEASIAIERFGFVRPGDDEPNADQS